MSFALPMEEVMSYVIFLTLSLWLEELPQELLFGLSTVKKWVANRNLYVKEPPLQLSVVYSLKGNSRQFL